MSTSLNNSQIINKPVIAIDKTINYVCFTMAMEGMPIPEHEISDLRKLSQGKITGDEYRAKILKDYGLK